MSGWFILLLIRPEWNWNSLRTRNVQRRSWAFNQTRMELKHVIIPVISGHTRLLIRPEWNWNGNSPADLQGLLWLLIRPEWNWNWVGKQGIPSIDYAFNQTRMELKLYWYLSAAGGGWRLLIRPEWNWNLDIDIDNDFTPDLLIRPEWNWNEHNRRMRLTLHVDF